MRILMIGPDKDQVKGGMSSVIKNYSEQNLNNQVDIVLISTVKGGNIVKKISTFIFSYICTVYNLIFKKIDVVHIHLASRKSFMRKSYYIKLAKFLNKKIIIHMHGGQFDKFYWDESNDRRKKKITNILNKADFVIALGEKWEESIKKYCDSSIEVISNAIYVDEYIEYNQHSKKILFMGRLEKDKGIYDLLEAFKEISKIFKDIELILAGNGELDKVRNIIIENKLEKKVILKGWMEKNEIDILLEDIAIFILPSYDEAMPMSILEAMAKGVPIISTKVGSIPEIISKENGILIEPGDNEKLVSSIETLMNNKKLREEISKNNHKKVLEQYNIKHNNKKIIKLYKKLKNNY